MDGPTLHLLPQPGGFERLLTLGERLQPDDEAVPQREEMTDQCLDLCAAFPGPGANLPKTRRAPTSNNSTGSAVEDSNDLRVTPSDTPSPARYCVGDVAGER